MASIDSAATSTITISGFSKTFSVTGWRIGYVAADARVAAPIGLVNDLFYVCAPTPLQWGIARALEIGDEYYATWPPTTRRSATCSPSALREAGFQPFVPQGAYYMLAEIPDGFATTARPPTTLIEEARVASVPGSAFYVQRAAATQMLRFCFAKDFEALEEACRRLARFSVTA